MNVLEREREIVSQVFLYQKANPNPRLAPHVTISEHKIWLSMHFCILGIPCFTFFPLKFLKFVGMEHGFRFPFNKYLNF